MTKYYVRAMQNYTLTVYLVRWEGINFASMYNFNYAVYTQIMV